jgi:hypothetical protein
MVAMYSIPQQEVAKGNGHNELALAKPTTLLSEVAKKPGPSKPSGGAAILYGFIVYKISLFPF